MNTIISLLITSAVWASGGEAQSPHFQSGDVIFHTSTSKQSYAIMWASKSLYSHVGIVEVDGDKRYVIEAIGRTSRTPLEKWISRGRLGRYALYRYNNINPDQQKKIVSEAKKSLGQRYDIFFTSKNDTLYCSELVGNVYQNVGIPIGKTQKVRDLDMDNSVVRVLVEKRWRQHPLCKKKIKSFEECWKLILEDELITPESIADDQKLTKVWSNYP